MENEYELTDDEIYDDVDDYQDEIDDPREYALGVAEGRY